MRIFVCERVCECLLKRIFVTTTPIGIYRLGSFFHHHYHNPFSLFHHRAHETAGATSQLNGSKICHQNIVVFTSSKGKCISLL